MFLLESTFKILLTVLLSGIIGLERGIRHKGAGIRTHILVGLGSALIVLTALHLTEVYKDITPVDPSRMISCIITGIGFLCAGTIIRGGTQHVSGLTTAATLWIASCIGVAVGCGLYVISILIVLVVFYVLVRIGDIEHHIENKIKDF